MARKTLNGNGELRADMRKMEARLSKKIADINKQTMKTLTVMLKKQRKDIVADIKKLLLKH